MTVCSQHCNIIACNNSTAAAYTQFRPALIEVLHNAKIRTFHPRRSIFCSLTLNIKGSPMVLCTSKVFTLQLFNLVYCSLKHPYINGFPQHKIIQLFVVELIKGFPIESDCKTFLDLTGTFIFLTGLD